MKFGQKVKAYPNGDEARVGFVIGTAGPHDDGKDNIQVGDQVFPLAYREPQDYDANGPGGTYCEC